MPSNEKLIEIIGKIDTLFRRLDDGKENSRELKEDIKEIKDYQTELYTENELLKARVCQSEKAIKDIRERLKERNDKTWKLISGILMLILSALVGAMASYMNKG